MNYAIASIRLFTCALGLCAYLASSAPALATGVAAGTFIESTATATYSNGAVTDTVDSNTVSILVDELLDVAVSSLDGGTVLLGGGAATLSFQVNNTGNGPEAFELTADPTLSGDDFDPSISLIAYDSNGNNTYDAGIDTVIPTGSATPLINADGSLRIFVVATLAGSPSNGETADVRLTAAAATGTGPAGTKFAGQGTGGGDAIVGTSTAEDGDLGTLLAEIGNVSLLKSATIADPFGGTQPVPGATVTYTLIASVGGTGSVSGLTIADPIPSGTTYSSASLMLDSSSLTDASGDDAGEASSSEISVDLATVNAGSSHTIKFSVTID